MQNSELAIIIPAYKQTYLRDTLESIANQTDKNFRLYIGDDCSPYDLKSIVDEFRDKIDLIYHRFDTNLGGTDLVAQWERCIALSEGEPYIWLFSDDDVMDPNCVEVINKHIVKNRNQGIFRINVSVIDGNMNVLKDVVFPQEISPKDLYIGKLNGTLECFVVEYVFFRKVYEELGGFVRFDLAWGSDLATWIEMSKFDNIISLPVGRIYWRKSGVNISTTLSASVLERKANALVDFLIWSERYFGNDAEIKMINRNGFISRITQMANQSNIKVGLNPVCRYSSNLKEKIGLLTRYIIISYLKSIYHVFSRNNAR